MNDYIQCSEIVANSFLEKDTVKVQECIQNLIEGHNKQNQGTLQKFFDQRDQEIPLLKTNSVDQSWVEIKKDEDGFWTTEKWNIEL